MNEIIDFNLQGGYFKLYRSIRDHWLWRNRRCFSQFEAWLDLLFRANYKPDNKYSIGNQIITQQRGEFITSQKDLSESWGWKNGRKRVERFLKLLVQEGMVTYQGTNQYTKICLINYEKYNPLSSEVSNQKGNGSSTDRQPMATINKDKKDKKENTQEMSKLIVSYGTGIKPLIEQYGDDKVLNAVKVMRADNNPARPIRNLVAYIAYVLQAGRKYEDTEEYKTIQANDKSYLETKKKYLNNGKIKESNSGQTATPGVAP